MEYSQSSSNEKQEFRCPLFHVFDIITLTPHLLTTNISLSGFISNTSKALSIVSKRRTHLLRRNLAASETREPNSCP